MGFGPVDAGVGDALAVDERLAGDQFLCAGNQVALEHDTDDVAVAGSDLIGDVAADQGLSGVVLETVGVAAVEISNGCVQLRKSDF